MMYPLRGTVRYLGTNFCGWQSQQDQRTVQGEIEAAMSKIASRPIRIQGAGRTDAGVHALGQVFSCEWPRPLNPTLRHALCMMLEPEIQITSLEPCAPDFNARFSAKSKRYCYTFNFSRETDPFSAPYSWLVPYPMDLDLVASLLPKLTGTHDFAGFQSTGSQMKTTVRTLFDVQLKRGGVIGPIDAANLWHIEFYGDGFLYKMVRSLAGLLIRIGEGAVPPESAKTILESRLRTAAVPTAPPQGLFLWRVGY